MSYSNERVCIASRGVSLLSQGDPRRQTAINTFDACENNGDPRRRMFQPVTGLYAKVFEAGNISSLDPMRCLSLKSLRTRPLCRWGVRRIKNTILGSCTSDSFVQGFVSTGKFGVLTQVPDEHLKLVVQHFIEEGETEEKARLLASSGAWYHVIDGAHLHQALVETMQEFSEKFAGFRWPVVEISWQADESLRAIGRMCNEIQKDHHVIDFPLPDAMKSLRDIIDAHSEASGVAIIPGERVKPGFIKEVMEIYSGRAGYSCATLRVVCTSVLKMSSCFVSAMRSLLTEECDDYWNALGQKRPFGDDTRVYKKLISTQSLKRATTFLDPKSLTDEDRLNVIHRLRFLARERESFKAFQSSEIECQSHSVLAARREIEKFEEFLGEESWPSEMENLKRNIFQTNLLDKDIREHCETPEILLPAMVVSYIRAKGVHGSQKLDQYNRRLEIEKSKAQDDVVGIAASRKGARRGGEVVMANSSDIDDGETAQNMVDVRECHDTSTEDGLHQSSDVDGMDEAEPDRILERSDIELRMSSLLDYERNSSDIGGKFDFVIADPFQKVPIEPGQERDGNSCSEIGNVDELVDEKAITLYLQCVRRTLKPGGFCFIFLEWNRLSEWTSCCEITQFEIICDPFMVTKDPTRVQKKRMNGLQNMYDPCVVLKKPGDNNFDLDKASPYVHLPACKMPRWCNVIDGVPPPPQRLTFKPSKVQVRPTEKPCALFIEILRTFCPPKGKVLDPRAGALTTGLACLASDRTCVLLETDERCLSHAKPRLVEFARSRMEEVESLAHRNGNRRTPVEEDRTPLQKDNGGTETFREVPMEHSSNSTTLEIAEIRRNDSLQKGTLTCHSRENSAGPKTSTNSISPNDTCSNPEEKSGRLRNMPCFYQRDFNGTDISLSSQRQNTTCDETENEQPDSESSYDRRDSGCIKKTLQFSKSRTPVISKRTIFVRSPQKNDESLLECSTHGGHRRSKRIRRPVNRYDH